MCVKFFLSDITFTVGFIQHFLAIISVEQCKQVMLEWPFLYFL